jgi:ferrochelatase
MEEELRRRGHDVSTFLGMQFTDPSISSAVATAREDGMEAIISLPMYPICGFSTNVAAARTVREAIQSLNWAVPVHELTAWHHDNAYTAYRAENILGFVAAEGVDLKDPDTLLYFSAHGTPIKYLDLGSRYDGYVEEHCERIAQLLGDVPYTLGYQNHSNRGIAWTEPGNELHLPTVRAKQLVVEPISFVHEQSETLAELDIDFREEVEALGMTMHRVPTPSDHARLAGILGDLLEPFLRGESPSTAGLHSCRCSPGAVCTNGHREVPSHYARQPKS